MDQTVSNDCLCIKLARYWWTVAMLVWMQMQWFECCKKAFLHDQYFWQYIFLLINIKCARYIVTRLSCCFYLLLQNYLRKLVSDALTLWLTWQGVTLLNLYFNCIIYVTSKQCWTFVFRQDIVGVGVGTVWWSFGEDLVACCHHLIRKWIQMKIKQFWIIITVLQLVR